MREHLHELVKVTYTVASLTLNATRRPVWNGIFRRCNTASGWKMAPPRKWFVWHTHFTSSFSIFPSWCMRGMVVWEVCLSFFSCTPRISLFCIMGFLSGVPLFFLGCLSDKVGTVCQSLTPQRTPPLYTRERLCLSPSSLWWMSRLTCRRHRQRTRWVVVTLAAPVLTNSFKLLRRSVRRNVTGS